MLGILELFVSSVSLAVSLAIIVPLSGCLVRFRANYNPKGLQLDPEGGAQPHTGPIVSSYFGMIRRVYRIEGWGGLYKGLMPTFMSTAFVTLLLILFLETPSGHGTYRAPNIGVLATFVYTFGIMLLSLPTAIITYRAITTPHRLPYFQPIRSLRILLTPTERRRPYILYLTPGLLAAEVAHVGYVVLVLGTLRRLLLPSLSHPGLPKFDDISLIRLSFYFILVIISTVILTPLEVIATRLAIQRNHASAEFNSVAQEEEGDAEEEADFAGADEDVIGLRNENDPYLGLADCARRIIDEEGWKALYRGWWVTMLGGLGTA